MVNASSGLVPSSCRVAESRNRYSDLSAPLAYGRLSKFRDLAPARAMRSLTSVGTEERFSPTPLVITAGYAKWNSLTAYSLPSLQRISTVGALGYLKLRVPGTLNTWVTSQPPLSAPSAYAMRFPHSAASTAGTNSLSDQSAWYRPGDDCHAIVGRILSLPGCTKSRSAQIQPTVLALSIRRVPLKWTGAKYTSRPLLTISWISDTPRGTGCSRHEKGLLGLFEAKDVGFTRLRKACNSALHNVSPAIITQGRRANA